jgi:hypothetical protein
MDQVGSQIERFAIICESEEQAQAIQAGMQNGDVRAVLSAIGLTKSQVEQAMAKSPADIAKLLGPLAEDCYLVYDSQHPA